MSEYVDLLARVAAPTGEGREVTDPATGETFGLVREQTVEDLDAAVAAAKAAQPAWAALGHARRIELLNAAADRIDANAEALGATAVARTGQAAERAERAVRGRRVLGVAAHRSGDASGAGGRHR